MLRTIGLLVAAGIAGWIAAQTTKGRSFIDLCLEARIEIRKVVWPTRQETTQTTIVVLIVIFIVAMMGSMLVAAVVVVLVRKNTSKDIFEMSEEDGVEELDDEIEEDYFEDDLDDDFFDDL